MSSFVGSGYVNVCSATGLSAPGFLPKELPTGPGDPYLCHVNTWAHFTGIDPSSGGIFNSKILADLSEYKSTQSFRRAAKRNSVLRKVVHISGTGKYKIYAAYPGSLESIADEIHELAHAQQLVPLKQYCPYIGSGTISN